MIKVGDIIERCTLMPAIVQQVIGDTVRVYDLSCISKDYRGNSECSIELCGVRVITPEFGIMLIVLGKTRLSNIRTRTDNYEDYDKLVKETYNKLIYETNLG